MPNLLRRIPFLILLGAFPAQSSAVPAPPPDLLVSVRGGTVSAPDVIPAGWTRLRVEEDGGGHILVVFRLPSSGTGADPAVFLAALDTAVGTPLQAVALGGPEVGDVGEVVIELTPGRYLLGCVRRGADQRRHASRGEMKQLMVTQPTGQSRRAAPPRATQEVRMGDFAYAGPEQWRAGPQLIRVENAGHQDHQIRLARLNPGKSVSDWMKAGDAASRTISGVARMGPGQVAYLPVELIPGNYVIYCLITDPGSGKPHLALGMFRAIPVL